MIKVNSISYVSSSHILKLKFEVGWGQKTTQQKHLISETASSLFVIFIRAHCGQSFGWTKPLIDFYFLLYSHIELFSITSSLLLFRFAAITQLCYILLPSFFFSSHIVCLFWGEMLSYVPWVSSHPCTNLLFASYLFFFCQEFRHSFYLTLNAHFVCASALFFYATDLKELSL